jgi:hypothetical protein
VIGFFVVGAVILARVDVAKGQAAAREWTARHAELAPRPN